MSNKKQHLRVALVGRPNVGKSTLFNRLSGKRLALVRDEPGITRDRHYALCDWQGITFELIDTAGVYLKAKKGLQQKMMGQAVSGMEEADVVICILDARLELTPEDHEWVQWTRSVSKPIIYAFNKIDSETTAINSSLYELGLETVYPISSETGRGLSQMLDQIVLLLPAVDLKPETENQEIFENDELEIVGDGELAEISKRMGPTKIALIGRPNVGKSTFFNSLLGFDRVVVDDTPGTTRDPINSVIKIDDKDYLFIDTAGLKKRGQTNEVIDKFSAVKTLKVIEQAECVFVLLDAVEGITEQDAHVIGEAFKKNRAILLLVNKWDAVPKDKKREAILDEITRKIHFIPYAPILFISAKEKSGFDKVFATLAQVVEEYGRRVTTAELNRAFEKIIDSHPLPVHAGKNIKIYYSTQTGIKPPTFVVFTNAPAHIHFSYERYLLNSLRKAFKFDRVPLRLLFRKK